MDFAFVMEVYMIDSFCGMAMAIWIIKRGIVGVHNLKKHFSCKMANGELDMLIITNNEWAYVDTLYIHILTR